MLSAKALAKSLFAGYLSPMAKPVPIGARGVSEERVQFEKTLTAFNHNLPPIYSTPDLVRLMEIAGSRALQPFCEKDEISVGTAINIEHRAPAGVNAVIKAEATVEAAEGRFFLIRVTARVDQQEIGGGTIKRAIVNVPKFLAKFGIPKP
jgi:predicted thioesterase